MAEAKRSLCDEQVYSKVFMEYVDVLYNYIYYQCGDAGMAQDITQDAFMKLWLNCSGVTPSKAKGYVFKSAKNALLNTIKRDKVKLKFQQNQLISTEKETPVYLLEQKEFSAALEQAISELPEHQRVVFLMSRIDKLTYKEIGELLGISKQAVEKRIYKALEKLRKLYKNID